MFEQRINIEFYDPEKTHQEIDPETKNIIVVKGTWLVRHRVNWSDKDYQLVDQLRLELLEKQKLKEQ